MPESQRLEGGSASGCPSVPQGEPEPRGGGGRTWRRGPRGDVSPRRAPVPARSAAERGTKRPAHSCALTHRRHVARRRRRFAQNWSGARAGRALRGGWERGAGRRRRSPPAQDFPKQARERAPRGCARSPRCREGQAGGRRVRVGEVGERGAGGGPGWIPARDHYFSLSLGFPFCQMGRRRARSSALGTSRLNCFLHQPHGKRVILPPFYK